VISRFFTKTVVFESECADSIQIKIASDPNASHVKKAGVDVGAGPTAANLGVKVTLIKKTQIESTFSVSKVMNKFIFNAPN
jgi:hypothetical protein